MSPVQIEDEAYVTLVTSDAYAFGATTLAASLRRTGTTRRLVCMVSRHGISQRMRALLELMFDSTFEVDIFDSKDMANLELMGRPELGVTFTKLSCWRLTNFRKCVFLDADTMVLQSIDELFERDEFSASPDVGWPDCFNSGVFVFKPSQETYDKLVKFATTQGSFDGGDQGLLNAFFNDWANDSNKRLPFTFNVAFAAAHFYSYMPAFVRFKDQIKIMHFLGQVKPWSFNVDSATGRLVVPPNMTMHALAIEFLERWWSLYNNSVRPSLKEIEPNYEPTDESMRRAAWEAGQAPYGGDSFMHIQRMIDSRLCEPIAKPAVVQQIAAAVAAGPGKAAPASQPAQPAKAPTTTAAAPQAKPAAAPAPAKAAAPAPAKPAPAKK